MKSLVLATLAGAFALATVSAKEVGKSAPQFAAKDVKGASVSLADMKGKTVVLEWVNFDCPFVKKHYSGGNMQKLQADAAAKGVVWITVNSAGEGKDAYMEPSKFGELASSKGSKAAHVITDGDGKIGKAFDAKVTPHMFVIDKEGKLVYDGAIDGNDSSDAADVDGADKLFANALEAVLAGKEVKNAKNKPYGCGVKY